MTILNDTETVTITYDGASTYIFIIFVEGEGITVTEAADTDLATTAVNIAAAVNAILTARSFGGLATAALGVVTITGAPGMTLSTVGGQVSGGAGTIASVHTVVGTVLLPDLIIAANGGGSTNTDGTARTQYRVGDAVTGVRLSDANEWGVPSPAAGTLVAGMPLYVETSGASAGLPVFSAVGSTTAMRVPGRVLVRIDPVDTTVTYVGHSA